MTDRISENAALLAKAKEGEKGAEEALVRNNLALVRSIALRFLGRGQDIEDLMQIGCMGLLKAVRGYDPAYGTAFSTYAVPLISGEIKVFDTSTFTVDGKTVESFMADVDTDDSFTPDKEVVKDGAVLESYYRSAPYFTLQIDGITLLNNKT